MDLPDIRRYLTCQYTGKGATDKVTVVFVGRDMTRTPYTAARCTDGQSSDGEHRPALSATSWPGGFQRTA